MTTLIEYNQKQTAILEQPDYQTKIENADFFCEFGNFLLKDSNTPTNVALSKFTQALQIFKNLNKEELPTAQSAKTTLLIYQTNELLAQVNNKIQSFPNNTDKIRLLETVSGIIQNAFVPTSGMTIQQHIEPDPQLVIQLHKEMNRQPNPMVDNKEFKNTLYTYHWSRVAASGGIVPSYMDKETGEIYIGLICNKRDLSTYNWSAGYSEAPLPRWTGTLQSMPKQNLTFDLAKLRNAGKEILIEQMLATKGDFTKLEFNPDEIEAAYKKRGVQRPPEDVSAEGTAERELGEEIKLDLSQYPNLKKFLISWSDELGISQGDAPGQLSNRNHQFGYFLGILDKPPILTPGDDVAIADWIKLSDIKRDPNNVTEYIATNAKGEKRPLSIYMLPALEKYFQMLRNHLIQEASKQTMPFCNEPISAFSDTKQLACEIYRHYGLTYQNSKSFNWFCQYLAGESSYNSLTGKLPQLLLPNILNIAEQLTQGKLVPARELLDAALRIIEKYVPIHISSHAVTSLQIPADVLNENLVQQGQTQPPAIPSFRF